MWLGWGDCFVRREEEDEGGEEEDEGEGEDEDEGGENKEEDKLKEEVCYEERKKFKNDLYIVRVIFLCISIFESKTHFLCN